MINLETKTMGKVHISVKAQAILEKQRIRKETNVYFINTITTTTEQGPLSSAILQGTH